MVSPLSTSRPVLAFWSRNASITFRIAASGGARFRSRGCTERCTPRAAWNSSMRLHRTTSTGSEEGAARAAGGSSRRRAKKCRPRAGGGPFSNGVPAFAGTTTCRASLGSLVFFDRTDIQGRDDLGDFLGDEARGDGGSIVVQH